MKRVAYYARVSTARQEQEATIESQITEIEKRIKDDGHILSPQLKFKDDGWSGGFLARPSLDKLRDAAKNKEFDTLYVYDRGRLARDYVCQEIVLMELRDLEVGFISLHDIDATTPEQEVMQKMQGVFHDYERIKIAERMRRGKLGKTRDGALLGYNPLYGYDYVAKISRKENGYFKINEDEAKVVRMIFDWVGNQEYSLRAVLKRLYELKIYPKKHKREFWTKGPILRLLKETSYIGKHYYNKTEAVLPPHPKELNGKYKKIKKSSRRIRPKDEWILYEKCPVIVDKEVFCKVQKQLELNKKYARRNKKNSYLLSGLVKCTCGITRVGQKGGDHLYYRCADRIYNYPLPKRCEQGSINVEVLDDLVWKNVLKLASSEDLLREKAEKWLNNRQISNKVGDTEDESRKNETAKFDEEEGKYLQAFGMGLVSVDVLKKQMSDLKNRRRMASAEVVEQKSVLNQTDFLSGLDIGELCRNVLVRFSKWDFSQKEQILRKIVDKIIASQNLAIVQGHIPVESENLNVALQSSCRNRGTAKRG